MTITPRPGKPIGYITDLADKIKNNGYDLSRAIDVASMPDGRLVQLGGHHRSAAMKQLGESTIPARIVVWLSISPGARRIYMRNFPDFPW